jgi:hypothetical protein
VLAGYKYVLLLQGLQMKELHYCDNMKLVDAWYEYVEGCFILNLNRVATEIDLQENHYLEEVGQIIETIAIKVRYCPYCGKKFDGANTSLSPSFVHYDFSKW